MCPLVSLLPTQPCLTLLQTWVGPCSDFNLPKILAQDLAVFNGLLADVRRGGVRQGGSSICLRLPALRQIFWPMFFSGALTPASFCAPPCLNQSFFCRSSPRSTRHVSETPASRR